MKIHALIAGLLLMSIVAGGFALAQSENAYKYDSPMAVKPVRVQAINVDGVEVQRSLDTQEVAGQAGLDDATLVDAVYDDLDKDVGEKKASGFGRAWIGNGYVIFDGNGEDYGKLARIVWVRKEIVAAAVDPQASYDASKTGFIARGVLQLKDTSSSETYKLVLNQDETQTDGTWYFSVMKGNEVVGTLKLEQDKAITGIVVWEGALKLDSYEGQGKMTFATTTSSVRKAVVKNDDIKPGTNMPYPSENVDVKTLCSAYKTDSEEYAKCKENAYKEYEDAQSTGKTKWTWEEFFTRLFKSDRSGSNSGKE